MTGSKVGYPSEQFPFLTKLFGPLEFSVYNRAERES